MTIDQHEHQEQDSAGFGNMLDDLALSDMQLDPDYDPEVEAEKAREQQEAKRQAKAAEQEEAEALKDKTEMQALIAIETYETILRTAGHPRFELSEKMKREAVEKYAPILAKYAPEALGFMKVYRVELMAAYFTSQLMFGSVRQIKQLKAEDKALAEQKSQEKKASAAPTAGPIDTPVSVSVVEGDESAAY